MTWREEIHVAIPGADRLVVDTAAVAIGVAVQIVHLVVMVITRLH